MVRGASNGRLLRLAIVLFVAVGVAACSKNKAADLAGNAVPGSAQDFQVNVGNRVLYTVDSSVLTAEGRSILDRQAQWLKTYDKYQVTIQGHADERGTREYNLALGARRATATRNYLVSQGIPGSRLSTISFGKERPEAVCASESCWAQNRRTVTALAGGSS
ncbi:MAG: peptidoglycan-associated lipoprotein Pal [Pseudomonadota bacterium]